MEEKQRGNWSSRFTFILAAVGSAVGLGNAWRFPGLAAKHGGGAFLMAYALLMVVFGVPLLYMEIAIGRKLRKGAPESMRGINKKAEPIGWAAVSNAFVIAIYYAVIFGWVIMMTIYSFKFFNMTGADKNILAGSLFDDLTQTTGKISGHSTMSTPVLMWFESYYQPFSITAGFRTIITDRLTDGRNLSFNVITDMQRVSVLVCLKEDREYEFETDVEVTKINKSSYFLTFDINGTRNVKITEKSNCN